MTLPIPLLGIDLPFAALSQFVMSTLISDQRRVDIETSSRCPSPVRSRRKSAAEIAKAAIAPVA